MILARVFVLAREGQSAFRDDGAERGSEDSFLFEGLKDGIQGASCF